VWLVCNLKLRFVFVTTCVCETWTLESLVHLLSAYQAYSALGCLIIYELWPGSEISRQAEWLTPTRPTMVEPLTIHEGSPASSKKVLPFGNLKPWVGSPMIT